LEGEGHSISVTALASSVPPEAVSALTRHGNLAIRAAPSHEELPGYLRGSTILFLPETFDPEKADQIRLSISTKAHLYMLSEKPILVYGSPVAGTVEYAKRDGWAHVVESRDRGSLSGALRRLIREEELRSTLVNRGREVALKNHDETKVRRLFLAALRNAAASRLGGS
jgi:glycosyltransferase involved in cell wall biosynthesis